MFSDYRKGATLVSVLVLAGVFLMMLQGSLNLFLTKHARIKQKQARVSALHQAEGNLVYWKWRFAHLPSDPEQTRSINRTLRDFQGRVIGEASITIDPPSPCDNLLTVTARVTPAARPDIQRTVSMQYGKPSLAKFSFLTNSNIWFGGGEELDGEIFANGGIRMDAEQNSIARSARATYTCGPEHGCGSRGETKPGIWGNGNGGEKGLWLFPSSSIDFESVAINLDEMRATARAADTLLPPSGAAGWHLILQAPATVTARRVTSRKPARWSYNGTQWIYDSVEIATETQFRTFVIPQTGCDGRNLIVAEDDVWVDGSFSAPLTIVAARFPQLPATYASIYPRANLTTPSGTKANVALIAQKDVRVPLEVPDKLELDAVLFAQHGHVFRNFYCAPGYLRQYGYSQRTDQIYCPSSNVPWYLRSDLELRGSLITNGIAAFTWVDANQRVISGFQDGENSFDSSLVYHPLPFLPVIDTYERIQWQDVTEK